MLGYKCEWGGIEFERVDRWYPSTKRCSGCGERKAYMGLDERVYACKSCGMGMERDLNAALNLKEYGLRSSGMDAASPAESLNGRGGAVRRTRGNLCVDARPTKRQSNQLTFSFA